MSIPAAERLARARLMLVLPLRAEAERIAARALAGGADAVQVRDPGAAEDDLVALARRLRPVCDAHGALLVLAGRADAALAAGADAVHLERPGPRSPGLLTGRSLDTAGALADPDADYVFVGPVWATPTKPGRAPVGLDLVREAARACPVPFFAVGGVTPANARDAVAAGARRLAVVRAVADAPDPEAAARALRAALPARPQPARTPDNRPA